MPNVHSKISNMAKLGAIKLSVLQVLEALEFFLCFSDCQSYCPSEEERLPTEDSVKEE